MTQFLCFQCLALRHPLSRLARTVGGTAFFDGFVLRFGQSFDGFEDDVAVNALRPHVPDHGVDLAHDAAPHR